jgi:hypothetical protein
MLSTQEQTPAPALSAPIEHSKSPLADLTGLRFAVSRPIESSELEFGSILCAAGVNHWHIEFPEAGRRHRTVLRDADARALALFSTEAECGRHFMSRAAA